MAHPDPWDQIHSPQARAKARATHARKRALDPVKFERALLTVENAPALTADQIERLRALLPPADPAGDDNAVA